MMLFFFAVLKEWFPRFQLCPHLKGQGKGAFSLPLTSGGADAVQREIFPVLTTL